MADRINSATRVLEIFKKLLEKKDYDSSLTPWVSIFQIEGKNSTKIHFEIQGHLAQLHEEVEMIRNYMISIDGIEQRFYTQHLDEINRFILNENSYINITSVIAEEIIRCLSFCRYILPDEGLLVNDEDIAELSSLLSSLELSLSDSTLPDYTKKIIQNNIDRIKAALRSYTVIGAKAFNSVTDSSIGEVVRNQTVFVDANDPETVTKFGKVLRKVFSIAEKTMKADGVITAGINFAHYGAKALEFIDKLI